MGEAPWLAGSPDGVCFENGSPCGLLEVKTAQCWCDRFDDDPLVDWLYQVHGCMRVASAAFGVPLCWCDLFLWTPGKTHCRRINFDNELWEGAMYPALRSFYFTRFLPVVAERERARKGRVQKRTGNHARKRQSRRHK